MKFCCEISRFRNVVKLPARASHELAMIARLPLAEW